MSWETWALFAITELMLSMTPGPAVLYVISQGLRGGAGTSLWSTCGILSANLFYFALSATSLGVVLAASYRLFLVVKYAGAAYLVWLGLKAIFSKADSMLARSAAPNPPGKIYVRGVALQLANPKALLFFTAIVPQFINPRQPVPMQILILGLTSVIPEFFVLMGYGTLAARASHLAAERRFAAWGDRISGGLLITAGAGLALVGRD